MSANGLNINKVPHKDPATLTGQELILLKSKTKAIPVKEITLDELIAKVGVDLPNTEIQTNSVANTDQTVLNLIEGDNINITEDGSGNATVAVAYIKDTVTQITAVTTGVTVNASLGVITTVAATTAAGGNFAFTVTNSKISATSVISLTSLNVGAGVLDLSLDAVPGAGSFVIRVNNTHATNAFNSVLGIHFRVD